MKNQKKYLLLDGDKPLWIVVFLLMIISVLVVYSATAGLAYTKFGGNTWHAFFRHFVLLSAGFLTMYVTSKIPKKYFPRGGQLLYFLCIPLLVYTLFNGVNINDSSRWISIGGRTIQTSDIAKLGVVMYLCRQLIKYKDFLSDFKVVSYRMLGPLLVTCALIFPANLSTAAMLFVVGMLLFYLGGVKLKFIIIYCSSILAVVSILILLALSVPQFQDSFPRAQTWVNRIQNFSEDKSVISDEYYQVAHAKIALVNGGLTGLGPGKSIQRNVLPHPYSDYVYSIIIEEYGLLGGFFVMALYLIIFLRGKRVFNVSKDSYTSLLAIGISIAIVMQALINMAVAVDLFPVTGQTLPLISWGGTSIIFTAMSFGLLINLSREISTPKPVIDVI